MNTTQLIKELESDDYILPKEILEKISEEELVREIEEIFKKYLQKLEAEQEFRAKYTELVNFLLVANLGKKEERKKYLFDPNLINYLLSAPDKV